MEFNSKSFSKDGVIIPMLEYLKEKRNLNVGKNVSTTSDPETKITFLSLLK